MLTRLNVFSPIPKVKFKLNKNNTGEYYNSTRKAALENIKTKNNKEILLEGLNIYDKYLSDYTNTLYHNLETLEFKITDSIKCDGYYKLDCKNNLCILKDTRLLPAYHELIHIASSYYNEDKNELYSGFLYSSNFGINLGEGITEGYVELLCSRHLNNNFLTYNYDINDDSCTTSYLYANILAHQLEILIGEEEMKYMFFNYGFFPINEFISKHTDQKTAYKFFKYCDIAAISDFHRDLILNAYIFKAQNILYDICKNYMPEKQMDLEKYLVYNLNIPTCVALQEEIQKRHIKSLEV